MLSMQFFQAFVLFTLTAGSSWVSLVSPMLLIAFCYVHKLLQTLYEDLLGF